MWRLVMSGLSLGVLAACSTSLGSDPDLGDLDLPDRVPSSEDAGKSSSDDDGSASASNVTLTVTLNGAGTVASTPAGVTCTGTTCKGTFPKGTTVTLQPSPTAGSVFAGWSGQCTGAAACAPVVSADATVTAEFLALDGKWTGTYTNTQKPSNCTFNNAGDLTTDLAGSGTTTTANVTGLEIRNGSCNLVDKRTGTAPSAPLTFTDGKLTGTWSFKVPNISGSLALPFTATFNGKTMTGTWTCATCTGSFTLTKQ